LEQGQGVVVIMAPLEVAPAIHYQGAEIGAGTSSPHRADASGPATTLGTKGHPPKKGSTLDLESELVTTVELDYGFIPKPRYGHGRATHKRLAQLIESRRESYRLALTSILEFKESFLKIPVHPSSDPIQPSWFNGWLPSLDTMMLYAFLAQKNPRHYVEIGSGNSTKFARRAIEDQGLRTHIVSVDPAPRSECDVLCDLIIREPFENLDPTLILEMIEPGDIVFLDGSHRSFMNTDTTAFFLDVMPELPKRTLVQVHDIQLPSDYGPDLSGHFYNEQYLLACWLLAGDTYEVVAPNCFITGDNELHDVLNEIWLDPALAGAEDSGVSFWLQRSS